MSDASPLDPLGEPRGAPQRLAITAVITAAAVAAVVLGLELLRMYQNYSPVPYNDMWGGYLGFMSRLSAGDSGAWWDLHNEHRIVLSRVLFWLDLEWFGGLQVFLLGCNLLIAAASVTAFALSLTRADLRLRSGPLRTVATLLILSWLFLGIQYNNLDWAFQSQFFLAQLLPLAGLLTLSEDVPQQKPGNFLIACVLGVAACGTMANGVLALPLMAAFAWLTKMKRRRIATLAFLAVATSGIYFVDLNTVQPHDSLFGQLTGNLSSVAYFSILFIGNPFHYLLEWRIREGGVLVCGLAFVAAFCIAAFSWFRSRPRRPFQLALLLFCVYVMASGTGIALGRLTMGVESALVSRYTTPPLMAWLALTLLHATTLIDLIERRRILAMGTFLVLAAAIVRVQWHAKDWTTYDPDRQEQVGLALALQVRDLDKLRAASPEIDVIETTSRWARDAKRSFFSVEPWRTVADIGLGRAMVASSSRTCAGRIASVRRLHGDERFVRLEGSLSIGGEDEGRNLVWFLNQRREVVGVAITQRRRLQWMASGARTNPEISFTGYLSTIELSSVMTVHADESGCEAQMEMQDAAAIR